MTHFTAIYTDVPLGSLCLSCLSEHELCPSHEWIIAKRTSNHYRTYISKKCGFIELGDDGKPMLVDMSALEGMYPEMNMYCSMQSLNEDLLNLAREYLEHGKQMIFFEVILSGGVVYPPEEELKRVAIDISDVHPNSMPIIDGKMFCPDTFVIYTVSKQENVLEYESET